MKTILVALFCVGALSMPMTSQAAGLSPAKVKACEKQPMSVECIQHFLKSDKVLEDIAAGKKPNIALPASPGSLGDLGELLSR